MITQTSTPTMKDLKARLMTAEANGDHRLMAVLLREILNQQKRIDRDVCRRVERVQRVLTGPACCFREYEIRAAWRDFDQLSAAGVRRRQRFTVARPAERS